MTPEKKEILLAKRKELQSQLKFDDFARQYILPFTEILDELENSDIAYEVKGIFYFKPEWKLKLAQILKQHPLQKYPFSENQMYESNHWIEDVDKQYPNTHPMRFLPDLPLHTELFDSSCQLLRSIIKQQRFEAQEVYLYYMRYAILLQVNLHHLSRVASEELFNFYHGDAIIFTENLDWLIAYSLEDEWRAGWKNSNT